MKLAIVGKDGSVLGTYEDKEYCDWEEMFDEIKSDAKIFSARGKLDIDFDEE